MKRYVYSRRNLPGVRHWLAAVVTVALLLTAVSAPAAHLGMIAPAQATTQEAAPAHAVNAMGEMADSGHVGCDGTGTKTCDKSALCMAACGKLPLQLAAALEFVPVELALKPVREPDIDRTDFPPSPMRRPPKVV